jgi:hypothetical protein
VQLILKTCGAEPWVAVEIKERQEPVYRQEQRGRPGAKTRYLPKQRTRFSVTLQVEEHLVRADEHSEGMFPLITNDRTRSHQKILAAYKFQPRLEKRHEQLKTVQHVTPLWLKNVSRIKALLFLYFAALLVHAFLERQLRQAMARECVLSLPLYPEERDCRAPSTERIPELFRPLQRHRLHDNGRLLRVFETELSPLQKQILQLLEIPPSAFKSP